ncbi:putative DNA primase/helicase [Volucribacter psittacicida]|uniref:Putative DNA primase/helicase n=1 Tax=Volucribacter psittacicida TaxID=203482 RepID=A0A4R1G4K1_9PAST|nr:DUF5906 domain-containing protein [Volucribacter psittacicida]TCK01681.1 putative DNA primase/helicase [Volucribacter psittacicida]
MANKLTNAPNLSEVAKRNEPLTELYILVGANAWAFYRKNAKDKATNGQGLDWQTFLDSVDGQNPDRYDSLPIVLGQHQINQLEGVKIAPKGYQIATLVYTEPNPLTQSQIATLCVNLAQNSDIQRLAIVNNIGERLEDLTDYLARIRQGDSVAEVVAENSQAQSSLDMADIIKGASPNDRAKYFIDWCEHTAEPRYQLAYNALNNRIYRYNGKAWESMNDTEILRLITAFFRHYDAKYSLEKVKGVRDCLTLDLPLMGIAKPNLLAFNNGILDKNSLELMPFDPDYWLIGFNPCDYCQDCLPTPNFDKWLTFISYGKDERRQAFLAALYMILFNRTEWQLTLELIGEAGGGKSVFIEVAKLLSGNGNHEGITLKELDNPVSRSKVLDKTFLYSSDEGRYIGDSSTFKKLSSGEPLDFNPKYKDPFSQSVNAIFAICSNSLPIYKNDGGGMDRRRVIFPFDKAVPEQDRDYQLVSKLKGELSGIIQKIISAFPTPDIALKALFIQKNSAEVLALKRDNDHLLDFVQEFDLLPMPSREGLIMGSLLHVPDLSTDLVFNRLYWIYLLYCHHHGIEAKYQLKPKHLERELIQAFKSSGFDIRFSIRTLAQGKRHTNATLKDKNATKQKLQND